MLIKTHKKTNQKLLLKTNRGLVSVFYLLDSFNKKIQDGYNVKGLPYYKVVLCLNKNIK